jgi:plasmid stability protein
MMISNWWFDIMPAVTIRNLSIQTHHALQARAARHKRSTEAEIRSILDEAARHEVTVPPGAALVALFKPLGGIDLIIERDQTPIEPLNLE